MSSIFDMYLRDSIIAKCEDFFNAYLEKEGVPEEGLTEDERELVSKQLGYLIKMIQNSYDDNENNEADAVAEIVDKLLGFCLLAKMNEARLCRILNNTERKK